MNASISEIESGYISAFGLRLHSGYKFVGDVLFFMVRGQWYPASWIIHDLEMQPKKPMFCTTATGEATDGRG